MKLEDYDPDKFYGGVKYDIHTVFTILSDYIDFYSYISGRTGITCSSVLCAKGVCDLDGILFSSIKCTLQSIRDLLKVGHINDAFALVRKYEDAILTHLYIDLLMEDEKKKIYMLDIQQYKFYENKISKWVNALSKYDLQANEFKLANFESVKELYGLFENSFKKGNSKRFSFKDFTLRQFCNNNVHYNSLRYFIWNDSSFLDLGETRIKLLDKMRVSLSNIFLVHFSFQLVINPSFFVSSDYLDALENNVEPEEGSENWVASIVQEMFNKYVAKWEEISDYLRCCNFLEIE